MNIAEAMAEIAEEAERQGFQARQTRSGMWMFLKNGHTYGFDPKNVTDVLAALSVLESAGLDWSKYWID